MNLQEEKSEHASVEKCYTLIITVFSLVVVIYCSSCVEKSKNSSLKLINIENGLENIQKVSLSQFADRIQYIPLETQDDLELSNALHCSFEDSHILVSDGKTCILYSETGDIISRIGMKGRGPGEYRGINQIGITPDKRILIHDYKRLLEYNLSGEFLGSYYSFQNLSSSGVAGKWLPVNDSFLIVQVRNDSGTEYYKAAVIDKFGKISVGFKNYVLFTSETRGGSTFSTISSIYNYFGRVGFKEAFNDTLFYLNHNLNLEPVFYLEMGKYSVTYLDFKSQRAFEREYAFVRNIFETKESIFFDLLGLCDSFRRTIPVQETITLMTGQVINREIWHYETSLLLVYDKLTEESVLVDISRLEGEVFKRGLVNDMDGGPRFYPAFMMDETKLVMPIMVNELKQHVASENFKDAPAKHPEKKKALEELANSLSESDNPVLMVVRMK